MPSAGFEPATPTTKRPQTYALDRSSTGIGDHKTNEDIKRAQSNLNFRQNYKL
jgi:hypothetical protein